MSSIPLSFRRPKAAKAVAGWPSPPPNFIGRFYYNNAGETWAPSIPKPEGPIKYLEIGCADGGNAIIISNSYCSHPESKVYCVDPWVDYPDYPEYKGLQEHAWNTFNTNIQNTGNSSKFSIHRGFSDTIVPTFEDNFFDIIFVDGNHETEYVYRDGVMSFQKVKSGGYIVFDDYHANWRQTIAGIDRFLSDYSSLIRVVAHPTRQHQVIIQKL